MKHYCRHCNERLRFGYMNDKLVMFSVVRTVHPEAGSALHCPQSPTNTHELR